MTSTAHQLFHRQSYGQTFESHAFSDGEAMVASSDAEVCDFGMGQMPIKNESKIVNGFGGGLDTDASEGSGDRVRNGTQEVTTNDFGTQFGPGPGDPGPGAQEVKSSIPAIPLNTTNGVLDRAAMGTPTGGGATGPKMRAVSRGSNDILSTYGWLAPSPVETGRAVSSTTPQVTTDIKRTYIGQLSTQNAAKGRPMGAPSGHALLMLGGVLLVVGLLLK